MSVSSQLHRPARVRVDSGALHVMVVGREVVASVALLQSV